jgi:hypothetical protein
MAARSALRAGRTLPPGFFIFQDSWYSFLLEAESTPGPVRPEWLCKFKNPPHRDLNLRPSGLQHSALTSTVPHVPVGSWLKMRTSLQIFVEVSHISIQQYLWNNLWHSRKCHAHEVVLFINKPIAETRIPPTNSVSSSNKVYKLFMGYMEKSINGLTHTRIYYYQHGWKWKLTFNS